MAAPTLVQKGQLAAATTTQYRATLETGAPTAGNLLVAWCVRDTGQALTAQGTWNSAGAVEDSESGDMATAFWKIAGSGEAADQLVATQPTNGFAVCIICEYSHANGWPANPVNRGAAQAWDNDENKPTGTLTPDAGRAAVIWCAAFCNGSATWSSETVNDSATGVVERGDATAGLTGGTAGCVWDLLVASTSGSYHGDTVSSRNNCDGGTFIIVFVANASASGIAANLTGTGSSTSAITVRVPAAANLTGTGTMTIAASVRTPITAALTGAGSLAAILTSPAQAIAANLTGAGSLTVALNAPRSPIAAALTGAGSWTAGLAAVASPVAAALTGAGSWTAGLGAVASPIAVVLTGAGSQTAGVAVAVPIAASLTGAGSLAAAVEVVSGGSILAALTGAGSLSAAVSVSSPVATALTGAGSLSVGLAVASPVAAALAGAGSLAAAVSASSPIAAALTGAGSLTAAVEVVEAQGIAASLTGTGSLAAALAVAVPIAADLTASGSLAAAVSVSEVVQPTPAPASGGFPGLSYFRQRPLPILIGRGLAIIRLVATAKLPDLVLLAQRTRRELSLVGGLAQHRSRGNAAARPEMRLQDQPARAVARLLPRDEQQQASLAERIRWLENRVRALEAQGEDDLLAMLMLQPAAA